MEAIREKGVRGFQTSITNPTSEHENVPFISKSILWTFVQYVFAYGFMSGWNHPIVGENNINPGRLWKHHVSEKLKALMDARNLKVTKRRTRRQGSRAK